MKSCTFGRSGVWPPSFCNCMFACSYVNVMFLGFLLARWNPLRHSTYNDPKIFVFGVFTDLAKIDGTSASSFWPLQNAQTKKDLMVKGTVVRETWKVFGVDLWSLGIFPYIYHRFMPNGDTWGIVGGPHYWRMYFSCNSRYGHVDIFGNKLYLRDPPQAVNSEAMYFLYFYSSAKA